MQGYSQNITNDISATPTGIVHWVSLFILLSSKKSKIQGLERG